MINTEKINENIFLHYIPMDKLKTTTLGLFIHRAVSKEEVSANALLARVLKRGCKKYNDSTKIAKYLQNLYGASFYGGVNPKGSDQIISFVTGGISDKYAPDGEKILEGMSELLLSVVFEPLAEDGAFKKDIVEQEKANLKDRINGLINDKRSYAIQRCKSEMCKGEPAGIYHLGSVEEVDKIDECRLYEHYKNVISNSVIDIYVCGEADISGIKNKLEEYISRLEFNTAAIAKCEARKQFGDIKRVTDRLDVTQGKLALGFRTNILPTDADYFALMTANSVFGSGAHSKLFNNVREKMSLAYYAASRLEKQSGIMLVDAGIQFENFEKAYDETLVQLRELQNGNISEEELDASIKAIVNVLETYKDDQVYMIEWYLSQKVDGTNYTIEQVKEKIEKVTVDDVKAAAEKIQLDTVYFLAGKEEN